MSFSINIQYLHSKSCSFDLYQVLKYRGEYCVNSEETVVKTFDEKLETRRVRNLRKEVIRLRREVAQLRKKNMRLENEIIYNSEDDTDENIQESQKYTEPSKERFECPSCGSYDVSEFEAGAYTFYNCSCGSRGRKKVEEKAS